MFIKSAKYIASYPSIKSCPDDFIPEYAFIGRSNVGKSSLINMLTAHKKMAHTSQKPGKTQLINYFLINEQWHVVDLPGYGYAKISKKMREKWRIMIYNYLKHRMVLQCAFVLLDASISPQKIDLEFINWCGANQVPFVLVFTKTDKDKPKVIEENIESFKTAMLETWNELPQYFITSSNDKKGRTEILEFIEGINRAFFEVVD